MRKSWGWVILPQESWYGENRQIFQDFISGGFGVFSNSNRVICAEPTRKLGDKPIFFILYYPIPISIIVIFLIEVQEQGGISVFWQKIKLAATVLYNQKTRQYAFMKLNRAPAIVYVYSRRVNYFVQGAKPLTSLANTALPNPPHSKTLGLTTAFRYQMVSRLLTL